LKEGPEEQNFGRFKFVTGPFFLLDYS